MPWNSEDGGGNKGPWGQGPWGQGPKTPKNGGGGNRGSTPPDLDEIIRRVRDSFNSVMPQGTGGTWILPILLVGAFWIYNSLYQVQPDQRGIVLRFGAYTRTTEPGLHFAAWPVEKMEMVRTGAENKTAIGDGDEGLMLTGDQNMVDIKFKVLWRIVDPQKFLFNTADQEAMVRAVAESAMREIVGRTPATQAMTNGKLEIQAQVLAILQETLDSYDAGIKINALTLEQVEAPPNVQDAFKEVQRAQQDQIDLTNKAQQYSNQKLREAEGTAAKIVQDAEGYKAQIVNEAKGEAQRFNQVYEQYAKAKDVTRERMYLETMETVMNGTNKVVIEPGKGGNGVVPYLPLPAIQPADANTGAKP